MQELEFQSTLPRRERLSQSMISPLLEQFQSTLPRRERPAASESSSLSIKFQSTLPRRERRTNIMRSTKRSIFQSTLPRRERHGVDRTKGNIVGFQSTLPRRERQQVAIHIQRVLQISIHAPTKGATKISSGNTITVENFNPRSHEGSDECPKYKRIIHSEFQSTLPRRERHLPTG